MDPAALRRDSLADFTGAQESATGQVAPGPRGATTPVLVALALALLLAAVLAAGQLGRGRALADLSNQATAALPLATAALTGVIEKQRLVPLTLARDPEVIALLAAPAPAEEARLDAKLRDIAAEAGSAVIYLIGDDGITVAASNAGQPDSFVGSDYGFRDYFTKAMTEGTAPNMRWAPSAGGRGSTCRAGSKRRAARSAWWWSRWSWTISRRAGAKAGSSSM